MFGEVREFPRAYTVPGIPHKVASTLGVQWALKQAAELGSSVSIYVPGKQNLRSDHPAVDALVKHGVPVRTWRERPGSGSHRRAVAGREELAASRGKRPRRSSCGDVGPAAGSWMGSREEGGAARRARA